MDTPFQPLAIAKYARILTDLGSSPGIGDMTIGMDEDEESAGRRLPRTVRRSGDYAWN